MKEDPGFIYRGLLKTYRPTKPVIAAVEGVAIAGGTEILQGTDIRVAGRERALRGVGGALVALPDGRLGRAAATPDPVHRRGRHPAHRQAHPGARGEGDRPDRLRGARRPGARQGAARSRRTIAANGPLAVEAILSTLHATEHMSEDEAFAYEQPIRLARHGVERLEGRPEGLRREAHAELHAHVVRATAEPRRGRGVVHVTPFRRAEIVGKSCVLVCSCSWSRSCSRSSRPPRPARGGGLGPCAGFTKGSQIAMRDNCFQGVAHIAQPGPITVTNEGQQIHNIVAVEGAFGTKGLAPGQRYQFDLERPGVYEYYCTFHGSATGAGMAGVLIVEDQASLAAARSDAGPLTPAAATSATTAATASGPGAAWGWVALGSAPARRCRALRVARGDPPPPGLRARPDRRGAPSPTVKRSRAAASTRSRANHAARSSSLSRQSVNPAWRILIVLTSCGSGTRSRPSPNSRSAYTNDCPTNSSSERGARSPYRSTIAAHSVGAPRHLLGERHRPVLARPPCRARAAIAGHAYAPHEHVAVRDVEDLVARVRRRPRPRDRAGEQLGAHDLEHRRRAAREVQRLPRLAEDRRRTRRWPG